MILVRSPLRITLSLAALLLLRRPCLAEETPAWAAAHRHLADTLSTALLVANVSADITHAWRAPQRARALQHEALRIGATIAVAELTKRLVHRRRPDDTDAFSFFSEHTAIAAAAGGWNISISIPLTLGTGYFRMAADKHFPTDVFTGALVGTLLRRAVPQ